MLKCLFNGFIEKTEFLFFWKNGGMYRVGSNCWRGYIWRVRFEYLFGDDCRPCYRGLVGSMGGLFFFICLPVMGREIKWALKMSRSELSILPTTPRMQNNPFFCAWIIKRAPSERTRFGARNSKKHVTF